MFLPGTSSRVSLVTALLLSSGNVGRPGGANAARSSAIEAIQAEAQRILAEWWSREKAAW